MCSHVESPNVEPNLFLRYAKYSSSDRKCEKQFNEYLKERGHVQPLDGLSDEFLRVKTDDVREWIRSGDPRWQDFWVRIEHHESLHAHDAVGVFTKGDKEGYLPIP